MKDFIIGIDIGGTHLRIGAVDRAGSVHHFEKHASSEVCAAGGSAGRLIALIRDYLSRNALVSQLDAIAIGFPSTVSRTPLEVRTNSTLPKFFSRFFTAWLTAGWEIASASAACVMLSYFPT